MTPNPGNSNEVIAGGAQLLVVNTSTGQLVRTVSAQDDSADAGLANELNGIPCSPGPRHH
jgi:hypothetical protein